MDGAAVEPLTGNCPGGVCKIPSGLPPLTVETKVPVAAMVAAGVFMLLCIGGVAYVVARKAK